MNTTNINQNQLEYAVNIQELMQLRDKGLTYRELAKHFNVQIGTIQYWFKKLGTTTIYGTYKRQHKVRESLPIYNNGDLSNAFKIDISDLTIKPLYGKHARSTMFAIFTVEIKDSKLAYVLPKTAIHNKTLIGNIMLKLKQRFNCNTVLGDSEFSYLKDNGFDVYKLAKWNCSKQTNDKHYGSLKRWIYSLLMHIKQLLNLTDEELIQNANLVKSIYIQQLTKYGYQVVDLTIGNNLVEYVNAIVR